MPADAPDVLVTRRPPPPRPLGASSRQSGPTGSPTGWVAVGAAGVGAALLVARLGSYAPGPCLARTHLGVACPACGLTHVADHLLQARPGTAIVQDLPGTVLLVLLALTAIGQVVAWRRGRTPTALRGPALPLALGALLAAHWALTLVTGGATT